MGGGTQLRHGFPAMLEVSCIHGRDGIIDQRRRCSRCLFPSRLLLCTRVKTPLLRQRFAGGHREDVVLLPLRS